MLSQLSSFLLNNINWFFFGNRKPLDTFFIHEYFCIKPTCLNDLGAIFYFTEPGSVFFSNLISFHDEVCFFLVWILVFTYWMLYSILVDHTYFIKPTKLHVSFSYLVLPIKYIIFFYTKCFTSIIISSITYLNSSNNGFYSPTLINLIQNKILTFIKKSVLSFLGLQYSNNIKNIDDFSFFEEKSVHKALLHNFDIKSKLLFSGTNSNILSIQGKLLEIEELYLLPNLSTDFNILILNKRTTTYFTKARQRFYSYQRNYLTKNKWVSTRSRDLALHRTYIISETLVANILNSFKNYSRKKKQPLFPYCSTIEKKQYLNNKSYVYKYNNIFNIDLNLQETFFYNRRFNNISYFFNPYIDVFNDIFSLNENTHSLYSYKEPGLYKWWEFKYLYIMTRSRLDYLNLYNLSRGVNRDIVIDSWTYHHSISFEYIWALFPTLVILSIIGPSFILLFSSLNFNDAFLSVKVIGHQWYWSYELSSEDALSDDSINFDSRLVDFNTFYDIDYLNAVNYWFDERDAIRYNYGHTIFTEEAQALATELLRKPNMLRLLSVDKRLVIIAHKPINFLITSGDVLHSFAIPAFGIKVDAVPGRINTFYLEGSKVGKYYGQCSELCGFGHGFMPIVVEVVKHKDILLKD